MAKVQIKAEKLTPFGGFFSITFGFRQKVEIYLFGRKYRNFAVENAFCKKHKQHNSAFHKKHKEIIIACYNIQTDKLWTPFLNAGGDFKVDGKWTFEVGGEKKSFAQIADLPNSFVLADDIESPRGNKLPLWMMRFLY